MGLIINGAVCTPGGILLETLDNFLKEHKEYFRCFSDNLKNQNEVVIDNGVASLYISQREFASISAESKVELIGSDMATTCHLVAVRCIQTGATSFGHFDGASTAVGVTDMLNDVIDLSNDCLTKHGHQVEGTRKSFDLFMVGGYDDDSGASAKLSLELLRCFQSPDLYIDVDINLVGFCCSSINTKLIEKREEQITSPVVFGLAMNVRTGMVFPASFHERAKTPAAGLRGALSLVGNQGMYNIFDWRTNQVVLHPFEMKPFPQAILWLKQTPSTIRRYMSTSPDVEPPQFYTAICRSLVFIVENPDPMETVFKGNRPLRFRLIGTSWEEIKEVPDLDDIDDDDDDIDDLPDLIPGDDDG